MSGARLTLAVANDPAKQLLNSVKQWRISRGLTQEEFAERAGMKYKHYQALEAGRKLDFHFETFLKLAKACGLDPWELLHPHAMPMAVGEGKNDRPDYGPAKRRSGR